MDFSHPFAALTPTLDGGVLRVLARTDRALTRREIAELIGDASEAGVRKVVRRLAEQGVVIEERIGVNFSYRLNREHLIWPAIQTVVDARDNLDRRIKDQVADWPIQPLSVEVFGSVAAGTATSESDVDLMVYRPHIDDADQATWDDLLANLRGLVERWTGNKCQLLEVDPPEMLEMAANQDPVLTAPRSPVAGLDLSTTIPTVELARRVMSSMQRVHGDRALRAAQQAAESAHTLSPGVRRTLAEVQRWMASPAYQDYVRALREAEKRAR